MPVPAHVEGVGFVAYAGELVGMPKRDALQRAHEVLDYIGLREERYRPVESYSTGMKQRIKLAAAIVHDPKLLILDEPTNGMDPAGREETLALARDLAHNKGINLLFSSHLLPDVEAVCDYIVVLGSGSVLTQGKIAELKQIHRRCFEVRLKADSGSFAGQLAAQGCLTRMRNDLLIVELPEGVSPQILWQTAARAAAADPLAAAAAQHAGRSFSQSRGARLMPIIDQGYQHWSGELSGHAWRWLTIAGMACASG